MGSLLYCFFVFATIYLYPVVVGTAVPTSNSLDKNERQPREPQFRNLGVVNVNSITSVTISGSNSIIYDFGSTNSLSGLGEKSVIRVTYQVTNSNSASLNFGKFLNFKKGFEMKDVYFDFYLDDTRTDKSSSPTFTQCNMFDDIDGATISNVQFRFHFSFTLSCVDANAAIIAKNVSAGTTINNLIFSFTDKTNPITITVIPSNVGSTISLLFYSISNGDIKGITIVGDSLINEPIGTFNYYYFSVVVSEQIIGSAQNVTVDLLEWTIKGSIYAAGIFYKANSLEGSLFIVRNRFKMLKGFESETATNAVFGGLVFHYARDKSTAEFNFNSIYLKVDVIYQLTTNNYIQFSGFFRYYADSTLMISCRTYLYSYANVIETYNNKYLYAGSDKQITKITNSFVHVDSVSNTTNKFTSIDFNDKPSGFYYTGEGVDTNSAAPYSSSALPDYLSSTLYSKSYIYYKYGLSLTDNGIRAPIDYNDRKNNDRAFRYNINERVPTIKMLRASPSLPEEVTINDINDLKESMIELKVLDTATGDVIIGVMCDSFLSGGGCNSYVTINENNPTNEAYVKLEYQKLPYWKTCVTFNVSSSDEDYNNYELNPVCFFVSNNDPSITMPECTEGQRCQYVLFTDETIQNYNVYLNDVEIHNSLSVINYGGRVYVDFIYPTNDIDEGDKYLVTLKTVYYNQTAGSTEHFDNLTIVNINEAGYTSSYEGVSMIGSDNIVGNLKINLHTTPMKTVHLLLSCGSLICEPNSIDIDNKDEVTIPVKRSYLTSYDYNSDNGKTVFTITGSISTEDTQYNVITFNSINAEVKNDIKAEIKVSIDKIDLSCSGNSIHQVSVLYGRVPEKDVYVSIIPKNKNIVITPNEMILNSDNEIVSININNIAVCRENLTEILTFTVNTEDRLYSSNQLSKATISISSIVYEHELDKSPAPKLDKMKLKDNSSELIEVTFDKIIYVDRMNDETKEVDCNVIIKESDVNTYGLSECKVKNENQLEIKYRSGITGDVSTITFNKNIIRSSRNSIYALNEETKVVEDRTPIPVMIKSIFNDNSGNQITVRFDRIIYGITTSQQSCSLVFNNDNLGNNCQLRKSGNNEIIIILGNSNSILPDDKLELLDNNPIVSSEGHINHAIGEIKVEYPINPPAVKPIINGGNILYECDKLILDGLSSEGGFGRKFNYEWKCDDGIDLIDEAISKANEKNDGYLTIEGNTSLPNSFRISLNVTSFLNKVGNTASIDVIKDTSNRYIEISIDGQNDINYKKDQTIDITGRGVLKTCKNELVPTELNYEWKCKNLDNNEEISIERLITGNIKTLFVEPGELDIGNYEFTLKVSKDSIFSVSSVRIYISVRDLVIMLDDASNQYIPPNKPLVLDISSSYDPDNYENNFIYTWECEMNNYEICKKTDGSSLLVDSKSIVTIPGNTLIPKNIYKFTGKIIGIKSKRSSSTTVIVNVLNDTIDLTTEIVVLNPKPYNMYDHEYMLELYGNIIGDYSPLSFEWIYLNDSLLNIFKPSLDGVNGKEITVDCSKLLNGKHRIMFKVIYKDYEFVSEFVFTVYTPPHGGYIITDKDSVNFGEKIKITTSGWTSISSLKYRFGVKIGDKMSYLSDYTVSNSYEGILPIGLSYDEYKLRIVVYAMDNYNGINKTIYDNNHNEVIIKSSPPINADTIQDTINELVISNNDDQVYVVIDGITNNLKKQCVNNEECYNEGECINWKCKCKEDFMGDNCEIHKPIDCVLSKNYTYGAYNKECGIAEREKWYDIDKRAEYGGKECEIIKEKEMTILETCIVNKDGNWSEWSEYSECDVKCEMYNSRDLLGKQYRTRNCTNPTPSGIGKYCEGESIEYRNCIVSCEAPRKPCPGEYIDNEGKVKGIACSGRGSCELSPTGCLAYEPGCVANCKCTNGYTGEKCEYNENEIEKESEINFLLIDSFKNSLDKIHNSAEIHSTLSSGIKKLSNSYSILNDTGRIDLLNLINKSVDKVRESKSSNLPLDSLKQYIEAASAILETEGKEKKMRQKSRILEEENGGKILVNVIENIGEIYNKNPSSESLTVNTDGISVTCESINSYNKYNRIPRRVKSESDSSDEVKDTSIGSTDLTLTNNHGCKTLELVEWNTVPSSNTDEKVVSGMVTINLHDENGKKNISNMNEPIFFRQKINEPKSMKDVECSYVDEETGELVSEGVYVYYIEKMEDGSVFVTCGTTHLSSFSIKTQNIIPKMNIVNPISDAKLLLNYSMENILVPIILGSVIVICVCTWCYTKYKDSKELSIVTKEKADKFLSVGKLDEESKRDEMKMKGVKLSIIKDFILRMKTDHSWLAPALRESDEIIVINRSQRILCLTCQVLTSTTINALFFGMNAENVGQLISTSIISTLCMLPCTMLIPWLYKYANGCTSTTISNKRKWWRLKTLKNRFKRYFMSSNANPELRGLKIGLLLVSSIYVVFAFIFYIISLFVMPFGVPSLLITACLIVLVLETVFSLIATNIKERMPFVFLFVADLIMFIVNVLLLIVSVSLVSGSNALGYNMWKAMYKNVAMKEFDIYIENNLNCCGFKDIDDYNIQDCLNPDLLASGFISRSCEIPLIETFKKYGAFWGIFFVVSFIIMLVKCFINLNYIFVNYNKVIDDNYKCILVNSAITQKAGQMIITLLRRALLKNRIRRKKEYVEWLKQRRMRSMMTICVNTTVFIYILVMIYINLLYGVKFSPNQANSWIISSAISMIIDVFIQQPSLILLNSVAASTMGAVLNFVA